MQSKYVYSKWFVRVVFQLQATSLGHVLDPMGGPEHCQCQLKLFCILIAICTYFQIGIKELGNMCYPHGVSSKAVNLAGITVFCRKECYDPSGAFVNSAFLSSSFPICLLLYLSFGITQFC